MPSTLPLPPRFKGEYFGANFVSAFRDPLELCRKAHRSMGNIFSLRMGPQNAVFLIGPEAHEAFFRHTDEQFTIYEPSEPLRHISGDIAFAPTKDEHRRLLAALKPLFGGASMAALHGVLREELDKWFHRLGPRGELDVVGEVATVGLDVSMRFLLGDTIHATRRDEFEAKYRAVLAGMSFVLPYWLPLPRFIRRDRALRSLRKTVRRALISSAAESSGEHNALAHFARLVQEEGPWTLEESSSLLLFLVIAAHETTSAFLAWALVLLAQHPEYTQRLRASLIAQAYGATSGRRERNEMLEGFIKEVERMYPPQTLLIRYVREEVAVGGFRVPKGWLAVACPPIAHRLPGIFRNPEAFDPERFSAERAEGKQKYALITFGGGAHACAGRAMALAKSRVLLAELIKRYELSEIGDVKPDPFALFHRPKVPCLLRYEKVREGG